MSTTTKVSNELFRSVFRTIDKDLLRWFPGHMEKGLRQMQHKLRQIDCVIEVHDARIPISGRNEDFKYTVSGVKPHILVFNKFDLVDKGYRTSIENKLKNDYENIIFTNCKNQHCKGVKRIFPLAHQLISNSDRFNRTGEDSYCMMVIGVPNVGKSSLVNALRVRNLGKGNASHVGAIPGITRSVLTKIKMCEDPLFYMLDTPGILTPRINSTEVGLKLALCATITDHLVGEQVIADYLLFWLNKHNHLKYVKHFGLEKPTDNILEVLTLISKSKNRMLKIKDTNNQYVLRPDLNFAAKLMLKAFRNGELGLVVLDEDLL